MYFTLDSVATIFPLFIYAILGAQFVHSFGMLILGTTLLHRYEDVISDPPVTVLDNVFNTLQKGMLGMGPYMYKKVERYSWFVGKALFLVLLCVQGILSIFIAVILSSLVDWILLL